MKGREIFDAITNDATNFKITPEECVDLERNFANYTGRAKAAGVIVSSGSWSGYQLASNVSASGANPSHDAEAQQAAAPVTEEGFGQFSGKPRQHWESFLHLPLTVALSSHFSARVLSMQNAADYVQWDNPDMLMLRPSPLARVQEYDPDLDPATFRLIDVTPECILASIEVKGGLNRNRAKLFTSIAEAAANSRWANEAWLAFVDWEPVEQELDEDVVSLARSVEVGLLEVRVPSDSKVPHLRTIIHHAAPTRATLRVGELTRERVGILHAAQDLLKEWKLPEPTFLDVDFAIQKARLLMQQAVRNLRI